MYTEFIAFDKMSKLAVDNKINNLDRLIRNEYVNHSLQMFIKYNYLPEHVIKKYINNARKYLKQVVFSYNIKVRSKLSILKNI